VGQSENAVATALIAMVISIWTEMLTEDGVGKKHVVILVEAIS
jgi:hypothetical protein